ncbi:hypothetical protein D3C87_2032350 [compost metagenome]
MIAHPLADGVDAHIAPQHAAELAAGEFHQAVGFAVAAWCQVGQDIEGQLGNGHF